MAPRAREIKITAAQGGGQKNLPARRTRQPHNFRLPGLTPIRRAHGIDVVPLGDRKSTRLNSSHGYISYAVFCLKKKRKQQLHRDTSMCEAQTVSLGTQPLL